MKVSFIRNQNVINPLPYTCYFFTVFALAAIGFFDSIYLTVSHYRVHTDMGYKSFCALSRALNCDTVSQSPYSILFGIPVPVWGIIGYALFTVLLIYAWPQRALRKRIWTLMFLLSLAFSVYSIILAAISIFEINSYCIMCVLSYAVNLMLLYFTWIVRKRFYCENLFEALKLDFRYLLGSLPTFIPTILIFCAAILLMGFSFPAYWQLSPPTLPENVPTGMTEDGHPWIGAEKPELVITEFTDYRCFQCKKMHYYLRELIAESPDRIRLVHRHFPMDHTINPIVNRPYHHGTAKLALVSIFATKKGCFWEVNDMLFKIPRDQEAINIRDIAKNAEIQYEEIKFVFRNRRLLKKLKEDIQEGLEYGLTGTPGFIINEQVYLGHIPAEVLSEYVR